MPSPCASSLRGPWAGLWSANIRKLGAGTAALLGPFLAGPNLGAAHGQGLAWGPEPVAPRLPLPSLLSQGPVHMAAPCTPVLTAQSTPLWPVVPEPRSPTQISSPSNQLPLNGEAARRGSALLRGWKPLPSQQTVRPQSHHKRASAAHTRPQPGNRGHLLSRSALHRDPYGLKLCAPSASEAQPHHSLGGHGTVSHGSPSPAASSQLAGQPYSTTTWSFASYSHSYTSCHRPAVCLKVFMLSSCLGL